jgi:hypothetical protein
MNHNKFAARSSDKMVFSIQDSAGGEFLTRKSKKLNQITSMFAKHDNAKRECGGLEQQ